MIHLVNVTTLQTAKETLAIGMRATGRSCSQTIERHDLDLDRAEAYRQAIGEMFFRANRDRYTVFTFLFNIDTHDYHEIRKNTDWLMDHNSSANLAIAQVTLHQLKTTDLKELPLDHSLLLSIVRGESIHV